MLESILVIETFDDMRLFFASACPSIKTLEWSQFAWSKNEIFWQN